jgi:thiol-disulfide isomerase/thioredoxin
MFWERLVILFLLALAVMAALWLLRRFQARRLAALQRQPLPVELPAPLEAGRPALLYFTTESCAQCRFQQTPILRQLAERIPIAIHTVDAVAHEHVANFFGVMTVPTTVLLDAQRQPVAINHGLTPLPRLQAQLQSLPQV